jgi:peptidoglycan biosynthesis protein MviN/MurJ (putative lipid II flippase)
VYCSALNLIAFVIVSVSLRDRLGHAAIAAGTSAGSLAQLAGLLLGLPRRVGPLGLAEVRSSALRSALASGVMGVVVYDVARLGYWNDAAAFGRNLAVYAFTVTFGVAVYVAGCALLRVRELNDLGAALGRKLKRS